MSTDRESRTRDEGVMPASRSSCNVRARAFGNPGSVATGAKYASSAAPIASKTARAASASAPASVPRARRAPSILVAAAFAASSVRLNRVRPKVAPARRAIARAKSSAAPRDAPTMTSSEAAGRPARKVRAAFSRAAADEDVTMRSIGPPVAVPGSRVTTAHAVVMRKRIACASGSGATL